MRKNSPRKWLHAVLDLLPVILIPVFMIYSHRHEINDGSIEVPTNIPITYNQLQDNGDFSNSFVGYSLGQNTTYSIDEPFATFSAIDSSVAGFRYVQTESLFNYLEGHKYVFRFYYSYSMVTNRSLSFRLIGSGGNYFNNAINYSDTLRFYSFEYDNLSSINARIQFVFDGIPSVDLGNINIFDLTLMFGSGNEITLDEFNSIFDDQYYDFNIGHKELLLGVNVVYDDTDIMSQFTYQLYNSVDKYFNMGNVFNLNGVYDWFNLNIFNGTAPIYVYIVWQIVLYEFVMDLLFLLYGLFMWFIDMVEHIMNKPFKSIK